MRIYTTFIQNLFKMKLLEYEKAIAKYNSGLSIKPMPLVSWDLFSQSFSDKHAALFDTSALHKLEVKNNWNTSWDFNKKLQSNTVIVVTNPNLKIVFASRNIVKMNGYTPREVIGNSPKMFQGEETDASISYEISQAIKQKQPFEKVVLNYCKDGSTYKCHIKGYPIFNQEGKLINFIAFEKIAA